MYQTDLNPQSTINTTKVFPSISQPRICGYFSLGSNREFVNNAHNLKYFKYPKPKSGQPLYLDLNQGFQIRKAKPESAKQEKIDHLLRYIIEHATQLKNAGFEAGEKSALNYNFICFRGLLRLLMCTPYDRRTSWIILASNYKGTIYLCAKDTPQKLHEAANETEKDKLFCYYGFKFEQYVLVGEPHHQPNTDEAVDEAEEFCALFKTSIEGKNILYGAEMDGIVASDSVDKRQVTVDLLNRLEFIEVKTKRRETNQRQTENFYRFKTRNWWCQSFLVNIKKLFVGLRDDRGIVNEVKEMNVRELEQHSGPYWSGSVCMAFCSRFLNLVSELLEPVNCRYTVYQFEYDSNKSKNVMYSVHEGPNEESFLPDWYCAVV